MTSIFSPCTCQLVTSPSQSKPLLKVEKNTKPPLQLPATPSPPPPKTITLTPSKHRPQNHFQKLAAKALDVLEFGLQTIEKSQPFPQTIDPDIQISGNYAPVSESEPTKALVVSGKIPTELCNGMYVRNGANPVFPPSSGHHLFDGDGMVHAVSFKGPYDASYTSHLTKTSRLKQEAAIGHAIFPKPIGELHGRSGLCRLALFYARTAAGILDSTQGIGAANAGLAYFNGKLLAMSEDDLPYHVDVTKGRDLRTVGRFDFDGQLDSPMIAHPKIDPVTAVRLLNHGPMI